MQAVFLNVMSCLFLAFCNRNRRGCRALQHSNGNAFKSRLFATGSGSYPSPSVWLLYSARGPTRGTPLECCRTTISKWKPRRRYCGEAAAKGNLKKEQLSDAAEPSREIELPPHTYQPTREELRQDMGVDATFDEVVAACMKPVKIRYGTPSKRKR